jgi:hypothetical protein
MTTQDISTAALHIVGQYNDAAKTLVSAYRTGAHRLLATAGTRYTSLLEDGRLPLVTEGIKARLIEGQAKANGFLAKRLDIDTSHVVNLMDKVAATTANGIESVADLAERVKSPLGLSVEIADKVAAGARKIEARVAGAADEEIASGAEGEAKPARRARAVAVRKTA